MVWDGLGVEQGVSVEPLRRAQSCRGEVRTSIQQQQQQQQHDE